MSETEAPGGRSPWVARGRRFGLGLMIGSCAVVLILVELVFGARIFLYQPFNAPSNSMAPTVLNGDYFFVSKFAYGYSRFSLPFAPPLFQGRIFAAEPARGDVVVFVLPRDSSVVYVKRLVGLPGDRIQMLDGRLSINGVPVRRERVADYVGPDPCGSQTAARVKRWRETLPNGASYETLDCVDNGFFDNTQLYTVPAGQYFMLGDNRDNSTDSRVRSAMGFIPFENLIGRVSLIFFSRAVGSNEVRSERIGTLVR